MNTNNLSIVISCIDYRFWPKTLELLKTKYGDFDLIEMAGASKNLISPLEPEDKISLLENIGISIKLHNSKKIVLTNHIDCGAYGGSTKFQTKEEEISFHKNELLEATKILKENFPEMIIETEFISKDENDNIVLL